MFLFFRDKLGLFKLKSTAYFNVSFANTNVLGPEVHHIVDAAAPVIATLEKIQGSASHPDFDETT